MAGDQVWKNISIALGAEPRDYPVLTGVSGIEHQFLSIAVDDHTRRIILVSSDPDPRSAALTQVDIQGAMPDMRVLIARPILLDLGVLSRQIISKIGSSKLHIGHTLAQIDRFSKLPKVKQDKLITSAVGVGVDRLKLAFEHVSLPMLAQFITVLQQAANFDWEAAISAAKDKNTNALISLESLAAIDNLATDRRHGICPVPLYELSEDEWRLLSSSRDVGEVQQKLREMGVYQYFFPAPDDLAMGFIDKGLNTVASVENGIGRASRLGHQISDPTLIDERESVIRMLEELKERGYVGEGEIGFEMTSEGALYRSNFKIRPKEGVIERIAKLIKINIDPTNFIK